MPPSPARAPAAMPAAVTVEIECFEQNTFCTSYSDGKYAEYASRVEQCIQQRLAADGLAFRIERNPGPGRDYVPYFSCKGWYVCESDPELKVRYPRQGAFEVALSWPTPGGVESVEVWSKLGSRRWPGPEKLAASVSDLVAAWPQRPGSAWEEALRRTGARRRGARGLGLAAQLLGELPVPSPAAAPSRKLPGRQHRPLSGPPAYGFRALPATPSSSSRAASAECSVSVSTADSSQDSDWSAGSALKHTRRLRIGPPRCSSAGSEQGTRRRRDLQRERELDQQLRREEAEALGRQQPECPEEGQESSCAAEAEAEAAARRPEAAAAGGHREPPRSAERTLAPPPCGGKAAWASDAPAAGAKRDDGSTVRPPAERGRCASEETPCHGAAPAPAPPEGAAPARGNGPAERGPAEAPAQLREAPAPASPPAAPQRPSAEDTVDPFGDAAAAAAASEPGSPRGRSEAEEESIELDCEDDEDVGADLWLTGEHCGRGPPPEPVPAPQIGEGGRVRAVHAPRLRTCALAAIAATRMRRAFAARGAPAKKQDADPLAGPSGSGVWRALPLPGAPTATRPPPGGPAAQGPHGGDGGAPAVEEAAPTLGGAHGPRGAPLLGAMGLEGRSAAEAQRRLDKVARGSKRQGGLSVWRQPGCDLVAALAGPFLDAALPLIGATDEAAEALPPERHPSPLEEWLPGVAADLARLVGAVCDEEGIGDVGAEEHPFRAREVEGASRLLGEALAERTSRPPSAHGRVDARRRRAGGRLAGPLARFVPRPIVTWGAVRSHVVSAASLACRGGQQDLSDPWDENIDRMLEDEVAAEGADWPDASPDAQRLKRGAAQQLLADLVSETAAEILWIWS